jgi:3-hydroxy-9,10-secoandrosta-1,3,5(10)-triene-9,17-dione monooxygenase
MLDQLQRTDPPAKSAERAFLERIDALLPTIRARAADTESLGRVPDDLVAALTEAGVFRAVQPRQWGGLEIHHASFYEGMVRIASACASTGWVSSVVGIHPWQIALFAPEAQRDVWGEDPDARASSSYAPTGSVTRVDGGFRLSGRWYFSSGVDHCGWVLLGGVDKEGEEGPEFRSFLVPRRDFTIDQESWNVTGMRGTGSKDVVVEDAFVPAHRTHRILDVYRGTDPGFAVNDRPYYRLPWRLVFGFTIAAPAIGAAVGALDAFVALNSVRVSAYGGQAIARSPLVQHHLARALVEVESARLRMHATWTDWTARLEAGDTIPYELRTQRLYEAALAHENCAQVVYDLMGVNGGRTMRADGALQRFFRDQMAMRNHPAANLEFSGGLFAQAKLGLEKPPFDPTQRFVI